ncbi:leucine-rich repeat and calponin homology domain-containing protein 2 [Nematostella vectensis]|nr:leucine-rich repeat and calponin homology domain-containing protein 2 [Nematostella vectensis]
MRDGRPFLHSNSIMHLNPAMAAANKSSERCFEEAEETGTLLLNGKGLRDFPDVADDCELIDVIEADLSKNRFTDFPVEICDFVMLEKLNLYHNSIRNLPDCLNRLKWLSVLNLRRNQICSLPVTLGQLPLRVLNLSNNKLTTLPIEIGYLTLLQDLDLSCNELPHLPSSMGEMISLKELNVRRNQLQSLPDELSKLKLVRLDFSCNKVSVIPPAYRLITTLSCLELSHNPLTSPPAQVCIKGRLHIFKYLSIAAHQQEKRRGLDRRPYGMRSTLSMKEEFLEREYPTVDKVRRAHSLDMSGSNIHITQVDDKPAVYRPSSLRERDRTRPPLTNVFETEEKRREIQKEIERAHQLIIADTRDHVEGHEAGSQPDGEMDEGEALEKEFLSIEMEERKRREEEETAIEERRRAARKLQRDQQELMQDTRRRSETANGVGDRSLRRNSGTSRSMSDRPPELPPRQSRTSTKPRASSLRMEEGYPGRQEEEMRAREALMIQSRREAQLSRQRLEEERLKSKQKHKESAARKGVAVREDDRGKADRDSWEENIFQNIHKRPNISQVRSLPRALQQQQDTPNFTIKRMYDSAREEFEKLEELREAIESRLKVTLPDDLPASLADGVVLCHLVNSAYKGTIPSIHIPSAGVPKLTMTKCMKNVDYFLEACKKLGVDRELLCSSADILQEKSPQRVCATVQALLDRADNC